MANDKRFISGEYFIDALFLQVRSLCLEMLDCLPSCKFIVAILHTLTKLSIHSLSTLPAQVILIVIPVVIQAINVTLSKTP